MGTQPSPLLQNRAEPPSIIDPLLSWSNGWIHQDATWYGMEVGLSSADFVLDGDPAPSQKRAEPLNFRPICFIRPNGCMDHGDTWYGGRPRRSRHCARRGPSSPSPKRGGALLPNFRPTYIVAKRLDSSPLGMEVGLSPWGFCVRWGPRSPPPKRGQSPQFSVHFCGQTAGCIKMPLCMEVGVGPSDFVKFGLDGDPAPPSPKRGRSPQFLAYVYCGKRLDASRCHLVRR